MEDKYGHAERLYDSAMTALRTNPRKFFKVIGFYGLVLFVGGIVLALPNFAVSYLSSNKTDQKTLFKTTKTIYSNGIPVESDIINLNGSGTLTPSPGNALKLSNICTPAASTFPYSDGMVLILNASFTLRDTYATANASPYRGMKFGDSPLSESNFFIFKSGATHNISTQGRTFAVTLSRMNDLSTEKDGPYYAYVFDVNEK